LKFLPLIWLKFDQYIT